MPQYVLGRAAIAIPYGVFPAVPWRTGYIMLFFTANAVAYLFNLTELCSDLIRVIRITPSREGQRAQALLL